MCSFFTEHDTKCQAEPPLCAKGDGVETGNVMEEEDPPLWVPQAQGSSELPGEHSHHDLERRKGSPGHAGPTAPRTCTNTLAMSPSWESSAAGTQACHSEQAAVTGKLETYVWSVWRRHYRCGVSGTHTASQDPTPRASKSKHPIPWTTHQDTHRPNTDLPESPLAMLRQPDRQADKARQAGTGLGRKPQCCSCPRGDLAPCTLLPLPGKHLPLPGTPQPPPSSAPAAHPAPPCTRPLVCGSACAAGTDGRAQPGPR